MRIRVITPVTNKIFAEKGARAYAENARPDVMVSSVSLEKGPASVESIYEESIAAPQVVRCAIEAERDGVDAVVIDCMNDPGLEAAREAVSIPVTASGGAGKLEHMAEVLLEGKADAVLAASIFHFGEYTVGDVKKFLASKGIPVRPV